MSPSAKLRSPPDQPLRRPLSPSCLRDVDLNPDMPVRKYAAPLSGHDLMAMFPPAPPDNFPEMRPGPTSGYFQRQERAFFAQAGKEIVRVRVELDIQQDAPPVKLSRSTNSRAPVTHPHPHPHPPPPPPPPPPSHQHPHQHHSPHSSISLSPPSAPAHYRQPATRNPQYPMPPTSQPQPQQQQQQQQQQPLQQPPPQQPPALRSPLSQPRVPKPEYPPEDFDEEAWRRPMPHAERRRAGKHTRRVIIRT